MKKENTSRKTLCRVLTGLTAGGKTEIGIDYDKQPEWKQRNLVPRSRGRFQKNE